MSSLHGVATDRNTLQESAQEDVILLVNNVITESIAVYLCQNRITMTLYGIAGDCIKRWL